MSISDDDADLLLDTLEKRVSTEERSFRSALVSNPNQEAIREAIGDLALISVKPECMARLHEIERMIVQDVVKDWHHLKCSGCLRWITALTRKAQGLDWK